MNTLLWGALPYVAFALLVSGLAWRHRYDAFGWTTRSSHIYESRLLSIASPAFHYGILFVLAGHLLGLFVPASWTDTIGVDEHVYHLFSLIGGTLAGLLAIAGIAALIYRRRTNAPVLLATTRNDRFMYVLLLGEIAMGLYAKLTNSSFQHGYGYGYGYGTTIAPWARSLFALTPRTALMTHVPVTYRIHAVLGMLLIAVVPYTRLIHMFSAPIQYLFRPYLIYQRPAAPTEPGAADTAVLRLRG